MTNPNKNFMVDFKLLCCCFSFLSIPNPRMFSFVTLSQSPRSYATQHSRSSARFSRENIFGFSISLSLPDVGAVYVLPGQRAYRSVQTTEFFPLMLFPSTFRFFIPHRPLPAAPSRSRAPFRPPPTFSGNIFGAFSPFAILRISVLWGTQTNDSFHMLLLEVLLSGEWAGWLTGGRGWDGGEQNTRDIRSKAVCVLISAGREE